MTPEEKARLEFELKLAKEAAEAKDDEIKKFTADQAKKDQELADLKKANEEQSKKLLEAAQKEESMKVVQFVNELKSEKLCSPSMAPFITELLGPKKQEYSVKIDKEEKKLNEKELLKETLKLFKAAAEVNFDENSSNGAVKNQVDEKAREEKIEKYAEENKITYSQAVKALGLLNKPVEENDEDEDGE